MPEDKDAKTVDIDTSGPEVDVELEDTSKSESEVIETVEQEADTKAEKPSDAKVAAETQATSTSSQDTSGENKPQKDELEDYSKDVQRRIAKLTKKWREAERQKDEALKYAEVVKIEKEATLKRYSVLEGASVKDREARIIAGLQAAKSKLSDARNNQDLNAEIDAQRDIARLGYEEARLMETKSAIESVPQDNRRTENSNINLNRSVEQEVRPDPKAESWGSRNKWFGSDSAMTYTAFDIHKKLVDDEGYDPQTDEYYAEIDKRIRLDFPHKFDKIATTETTKPVQVVASAKRSTKPGRKTVRLTPSQVAIAKKLGVPLEEYAKQLNITKEV
jgi:hypothetical protein